MNTRSPERREQLLDLLVDRALQGLDLAERVELEGLLASFPELDDERFELAAAAADLALFPPDDEPLPAELRRRVAADARACLAPGPTAAARRPGHAAPPPRRRALAPREALAWLTAAAAVVLALVLRPGPPPAPPSPGEQRAALLAEAPDTLRVAWTATDDPAARDASGDVVWSTARQQGYLRLHGLAVNDPAREQYQLWIFDATRDERHPVDGGVFDVDRATGDVIVPIHAAVRVSEPTLFAVTVERPGGVVVSSRERLPLMAKVGG